MRLIVTQSRPKRTPKTPKQILSVDVVIREGQRLDWVPVAALERGELSDYDFCLKSIEALGRLRRQRKDERPLRRRWEQGRCVFEVEDWVGVDAMTK